MGRMCGMDSKTRSTGTVAALASLCMVYNEQIMDLPQLYDWVKDNINSISLLFFTKKDHNTEENILKGRFESKRYLINNFTLQS